MLLLGGCPQGAVEPPAVALQSQLRLLDVQTGAVVGQAGLDEARVRDLAVSPDGARVAAAASDGAVFLCLTEGAKPLNNPDLRTGPAALNAVAFSGDGSILAAANGEGKVFLFDALGGASKAELQAHDSGVTCLAAVDAGTRIASADQDGILKVWDLSRKELIRAQRVVPTGGVRAMAASAAAGAVATAGADGVLRLWDADGSPKAVVPAAELGAAVTVMAFSGSGTMLAAGTEDGRVLLFDPQKHLLERGAMQCAKNPIVGVGFCGEGSVVVGCQKGCLKIFDLSGGGGLVKELPKADALGAMAVTGDGRTVIAGK